MSQVSAKPANTSWTDEQWDAISLTGENMLVAAAAGSGKTAVLVERIIRRISDESNPVDVDCLLVATFTKAAASEMRHRIRAALEKRLETSPDSRHLRRQLALLNRAAITTLHSFCQEVIRRHYQLIRLDPGFRVANETEISLMRQELLEDLFEERYAAEEEDGDFTRLVEWFGGVKGDEPLMRLVLRLFDTSQSHPWPQDWLLEMGGRFNIAGGELDEGRTLWQQSLMADIRLELAGAAGLLKEAARWAESPGGPAPYLENLKEELLLVEHLQEAALLQWGHLFHAFQAVSFGKLKPCKGDRYDKALQDKVKALRDNVKKRLNKLQSELFERTPEQFAEELRVISPVVGTLVGLVLEFAERYRAEKTAKGLLDFADLEHFCLKILRDPGSAPGSLIPSHAAMEYRALFVEVLLDEYQDTNRVQEAIVELISRPGSGNRFMVGDVKQSIYRFRLAEPGLFLEKYKLYRKEGTGAGRRIDLARNFRSRTQVVDGVNFLFRQIMRGPVGEIEYDVSAELVKGAPYSASNGSDLSVELLLVDRARDESGSDGAEMPEETRGAEASDAGPFGGDEGESGADGEESGEGDMPLPLTGAELETAQTEARLIARHIKSLMGVSGERAFQVTDKSGTGFRPLLLRDIVILMRATRDWSPVFVEELRLAGIPAYAELATGYFSATEVETMLSLLKIIDNPAQDIPLAGVLRSPIVGLTAEELARVRLADRAGSFYDALLAAAGEGVDSEQPEPESADGGTSDPGAEPVVAEELAGRLKAFIRRLSGWRADSRETDLSRLIWKLYRETGYFDFVGGLPGGSQRQANLRALYDRARQYESTSFRGLFRFLRFLGRLQENGGDLGTAGALGEQEDVVRIMSIHKSKGLEFPVVFAAGMAKMFNQMDLNASFLLHKELGFGPRFMDTALRVTYPTLPFLAVKRRLRLETLAEEMRVLYVALTRAREKLYLIGTVSNLDKLLERWSLLLDHPDLALPDDVLAGAKCYLDWLGPALIRHPAAAALRERSGGGYLPPSWMAGEPSAWSIRVVRDDFAAVEAEAASGAAPADEAALDAVRRLAPVIHPASGMEAGIARTLAWTYPHEAAVRLASKISVTEMKRLAEERTAKTFADDVSWEALRPPMAAESGRQPVYRRPKFMERREMTAAERGTVYHAVMQHVKLHPGLSEADVRETIRSMVDKRMVTEEQGGAVDALELAAFFATAVGRRLLRARGVYREVPFTYALPASEAYPDAGEGSDEKVLIQGIIDCLFEDENGGLVLLDYKTDATRGLDDGPLAERYRVQLGMYARAVQDIWKRPIGETWLYFFDGGRLVRLADAPQ